MMPRLGLGSIPEIKSKGGKKKVSLPIFIVQDNYRFLIEYSWPLINYYLSGSTAFPQPLPSLAVNN